MKHIHIYRRIPSNYRLYRCNVKTCLGKFRKEDIIGKITLCSKCGKETTMSGQNLSTALPRCEFCSNCKSAIEKRNMQNAAANVMGDLIADLFDETSKEPEPIRITDLLGE